MTELLAQVVEVAECAAEEEVLADVAEWFEAIDDTGCRRALLVGRLLQPFGDVSPDGLSVDGKDRADLNARNAARGSWQCVGLGLRGSLPP